MGAMAATEPFADKNTVFRKLRAKSDNKVGYFFLGVVDSIGDSRLIARALSLCVSAICVRARMCDFCFLLCNFRS